ncbi:hypothetical protein [Mycolicibacter sinensis]|nr:hypothetical protein [Mycolicibacter sinensis]
MRTQIRQAHNMFRAIQLRVLLLASDESGMSTVEYAQVVVYTPNA